MYGVLDYSVRIIRKSTVVGYLVGAPILRTRTLEQHTACAATPHKQSTVVQVEVRFLPVRIVSDTGTGTSSMTKGARESLSKARKSSSQARIIFSILNLCYQILST
jgi:hypothetical protein